MTNITPTAPVRYTVMTSTPTVATRRREAREAEPPAQSEIQSPSCFARVFNQAFEQIMIKLFGRDGRG